MHLNVANVKTWYGERYPELTIGDIVPGLCFDCFPELEKGMRVQLRLKLGKYQVDRGDEGIVEKVYPSKDGELFEVRFTKGEKEFVEIFCRPELKKVRE